MTLRSEKNSNFDSNISEKSSRIRKFCSVNEIETFFSEAFCQDFVQRVLWTPYTFYSKRWKRAELSVSYGEKHFQFRAAGAWLHSFEL